RNVGSTGLTLTTGPTALGLGFSVLSPYAAPVTIPTGGTATFQVRLNAASVGPSSATLSFNDDDADNRDGVESPFSFPVSGSASTTVILDDGDAGYTNTGLWQSAAGQGFQNDVHYIAAGNGADLATWTFTGLTPGLYRVAATWTPFGNRGTNVPYRIKD